MPTPFGASNTNVTQQAQAPEAAPQIKNPISLSQFGQRSQQPTMQQDQSLGQDPFQNYQRKFASFYGDSSNRELMSL